MTLESNYETVAILYDIENAPFEMLNYTLGKARRYQPCRTIVVSDWDAHPDQKRWEKLLRRPGFTFRQINRTYFGKNSLDSALYDSAKILYKEGVRRYFIITTDSDFVRIAEHLNSEEKSYIIGIGTKQASETLRNAYDEFLVYPPEEKKKTRSTKKTSSQTADEVEGKDKEAAEAETGGKTSKTARRRFKTIDNVAAASKSSQEVEEDSKTVKGKKAKKATDKDSGKTKEGKKAKEAEQVKVSEKKKKSGDKKSVTSDKEFSISVRLPKTLFLSLEKRKKHEGVPMDELVTYLLMRGLSD